MTSLIPQSCLTRDRMLRQRRNYQPGEENEPGEPGPGEVQMLSCSSCKIISLAFFRKMLLKYVYRVTPQSHNNCVMKLLRLQGLGAKCICVKLKYYFSLGPVM